FSALTTNPESRCGRNPTVVRMTRSQEASTIGRFIDAGDVKFAATRRAALLVRQPPNATPATARLPVLSKLRLSMRSSLGSGRLRAADLQFVTDIRPPTSASRSRRNPILGAIISSQL